MDWAFPPELQKKYDEITARIRRLQAELGIVPMTLEQRALRFQQQQEERQRQQEREARLKQLVQSRRPPPKWKV